MKINDEFHQQAILNCVNKLRSSSSTQLVSFGILYFIAISRVGRTSIAGDFFISFNPDLDCSFNWNFLLLVSVVKLIYLTEKAYR